jgi:nucleoside-diphosphate-sugar epimerase
MYPVASMVAICPLLIIPPFSPLHRCLDLPVHIVTYAASLHGNKSWGRLYALARSAISVACCLADCSGMCAMTMAARPSLEFLPPLPTRAALPSISTGLRPTIGTFLRTGVDVACVWIAFLFSWFLVQRKDLIALIGPDPLTLDPLLIGLLSLITPCFYTAVGLYNKRSANSGISNNSSITFSKCRCIIMVDAALFMAAGAFIGITRSGITISLAVLCSGMCGSIILHCFARLGAIVLRSESRQSDGLQDLVDESKVLVIGGAGYIGSALVEQLLALNLKVLVLDAMHFGEEALSSVTKHPNLTIVREDFRHIEALTRAMDGIGSVIHLGGLVGDPACAVDAELTVDVNVRATKLIGEIAKARGVRRFIFASSCSVYGATDEIVNEGSALNPQSLYAHSKVASEVVLRALNDERFAVTCLRFATIYGISGRTRFDLVVNLLCAKAIRDQMITVHGPDQWRPFVHVQDVARAIAMALRAPLDQIWGEIFNVGSDEQNYTLQRVAELIKLQAPAANILIEDKVSDKRNYRVSFAKIRDRLGFTPVWSLDRGIAQVVALARSNAVGHYSLPTYSNVLYLVEHGTERFCRFKIAGWENELMKTSAIRLSNEARSAA